MTNYTFASPRGVGMSLKGPLGKLQTKRNQRPVVFLIYLTM